MRDRNIFSLVTDWSSGDSVKKLPVYDEREREALRDALKHYKKRHNNLGDSKLFGRMYFVLDPQHLVYLSQSTMQRFLRNKGRTDDEGVWAIKTFLERAVPPSGISELAKSLADRFLVPFGTVPPLFQPVETYQGRYEVYLTPYTGEFFDTKFDKARPMHYIFLPTVDPRFLDIWTDYSEDTMTTPPFRCFLRCGAFQFLLISSGFGGATFTLLSHIDDDPLVLQGTMMQTALEWPAQKPPYEIRLVRIDAPKIGRKQPPRGQYGNRTTD